MMATSNLPVTSREYKIMLKVNRFKKRDEGIADFFVLVKSLLKTAGGKLLKQQKAEERRTTSYLDTPDLNLRELGFSLRLRDESESDGKFDIDLKLRSGDRYLSAAQNLSARKPGTIKFEEDIIPPFISKFSHSNKVPLPEKPDFNTIGEAAAVFPALASLGIAKNTPLGTIKNFEAAEVVRKLCKFGFEETTELKASLSFWYVPGKENGVPLVAEFSFDYDLLAEPPENELEVYPIAVVEGANRFFNLLQAETKWIDPNGTTKTAFAVDV